MIDKINKTNLRKIVNNIEITDQKTIRILENSIKKENLEEIGI